MNLLPENIVNLSAISTDPVSLPLFNNNDITLDVLRLDQVDPVISGNKWFKLHYYLEHALNEKHKRLLTFGGAYSNHILATAAAAQRLGLQSTGIIRGEKPVNLSPTLQQALQMGMELKFVSRLIYNQKKNPAFMNELRRQNPATCIIPEGGEGQTGIRGAVDILQTAADKAYTHILCAVGTGTMFTGLALAATLEQHVIGIAVLKEFEKWLASNNLLNEKQNLQIITAYHFGGYAKKNNALFEFMNEWYEATGIPTDFVYTGKLFFALTDLVKQGYFPKKSRLLAIHSGGLQGNKSLPLKTLNF